MNEREPAVDPHLLAALRHAPDRDAEPPPQVTARILAAARDAVRPPVPSAPSWQRLAAWFARPQVGAAFATLAVATLVGVMWSTHEPPVLMPAPTEGAAPSPVPHAPPRALAPPPAPVTATPAAPAPERAPAPAALERRKAQAERRQEVAREAAAPTAADAAPAPTPAVPAQAPAKVAADAAAAPTAAAPAEAAAKADAVAPALPSGTAAAPPPTAAAAEARARGERAATNELGALASGRASAPAAALSLAQRERLFDPLQALDAAGMDGSVWILAGAAGERAHGEPQHALWAALRQATAGRWQPHSSAPSSAPWLVLRQGGQRTTFRLADGALTVTDDQGRTWRAPVSAGQARDWQLSVGSW
jgi:hypothetical protein